MSIVMSVDVISPSFTTENHEADKLNMTHVSINYTRLECKQIQPLKQNYVKY